MSRARGSVSKAAKESVVVRQMLSPPQRSLTLGPKSTCMGVASSFGALVQLDAAFVGGKQALRGCEDSAVSKGLWEEAAVCAARSSSTCCNFLASITKSIAFVALRGRGAATWGSAPEGFSGGEGARSCASVPIQSVSLMLRRGGLIEQLRDTKWVAIEQCLDVRKLPRNFFRGEMARNESNRQPRK